MDMIKIFINIRIGKMEQRKSWKIIEEEKSKFEWDKNVKYY